VIINDTTREGSHYKASNCSSIWGNTTRLTEEIFSRTSEERSEVTLLVCGAARHYVGLRIGSLGEGFPE
jgi:hypothetical protein